MNEIQLQKVIYFDGSGEKFAVSASNRVDGAGCVLAEHQDPEKCWSSAYTELSRLIDELEDARQQWREKFIV